MYLFLSFLFALAVSQQYLLADTLSATPAQRKVQTPQDMPLKIITHDNYTLCYIPTFSLGAEHGSYIGILNCAVQGAIPARYDVFGRIGFYMNKTWLCITAPDSVALYARGKDYLYLSPCVINLKNQQWKIKDDGFYAHDDFYSIKDDGSYLYAVNRLEGGLYRHKLHPSMQGWAKTIAMPGNLSIITWLAWDIIDKYTQERYFLRNNQSDKNTTFLYYNIQSGHIAQYDYNSGSLYCMYSNTGKKDWDWVVWGLCDDSKPPQQNRAYFKPILISGSNFAFQDKDGNVLRLTRYGTHWGVPYTVNKSYLLKDTRSSPISAFAVNFYMQEWFRFIYANIGKNLHSCPAIGYNTKAITNNPPLPSGFSLSQEWKNRLYAINVSSNAALPSSGICGTCLLQAYQMIAELLHNTAQPLTSGGYFFDTAPLANPFISFQARNSLLHQTLNDILEYYNYPIAGGRDSFLRNVDRAFASSISMLPQYDWSRLGVGTDRAGVNALLQRVIGAPVGSVFLFTMARFDRHLQRLSAHAMPVLRLQEGVVAIPANALVSQEEFISRLSPANNAQDLTERLTRFGGRHLELVGLGVFSINHVYFNSFENIVSLNDCTGDGEDRRGNALIPLPELINQCISGRCEF